MSAKPQPAPQTNADASNRAYLRPLIFVIIQFAILFVASGRIAWLGAYLFIVLCSVSMVASRMVVPRELLNARAKAGEGWKQWDKFILPLIIFGPIIVSVVAGFDVRYGWSRPFSLGLQLTAIGAIMMGHVLILWAMRVNRHFEGVVRIQHDRDHAVVMAGPYRFVRHPGYVGMLVFQMCTPLVLGSRAALIPSAAMALALVVRTALEDRMLRHELPGYADYAARVRYRLLPFVW